MLHVLAPIAALLAGVALLLLGGGLLGTLLAVRGSAEGFSDATLGIVMSGYFVGFFFGTFLAPKLIQRIGHIRGFAFYAAAAACAVLLHAMLVSPLAWFGLRVVTGVALVGLYTVIESWLNAQAGASRRGQVFAIYMVVSLGALAAGQHLLRLEGAGAFTLFALVALLTCAAVMPVTWTRLTQPVLHDTPRLQIRALYERAPSAVAGALFSGLAMGAFWALGPLFATRSGMDGAQIAWFMSIGILGGAVLQWPLGRLSDRHDRRIALILVSVAATLTALIGAAGVGSIALLYMMMFVYGGLAFAVYPISVAHLMDHLEPESLLQGSSTALLLHGIGAALSPLLAGWAMGRFGPGALWAYFALVQGVLCGVVGWRYASFRRTGTAYEGHFLPMLRTTPAALEMLPESEASPGGGPAGTGSATPAADPVDRD